MILYQYNSINLEVEHQLFEVSDLKEQPLHAHDYFEVCCFLKGQAAYRIEGNEYPLLPGDIVVLRPGEAHCILPADGISFERILLSFGQSFFNTIDSQKELFPPFYDRETGHRNLYRSADFPDLPLQQYFTQMVQKGDRFHVITQLLALLQTLNQAFERLPSYEQPTESLETTLIRLINDNYHLELSLQELSDRFFISRAQLCRRFQKATGISIGRYITIKRLNAARQLILQERKASDVCAMCGFKDYSTFYRAYTKYFGYSPSTTRR